VIKRPILKYLILVLGVIALAWVFLPGTDVVAPDWTVLVTDTSGHSIAGADVTLFSQQYTTETQDTEQTAITGNDGYAYFTGRKIHANGLLRMFGVLRNLDQGVHASFGVHTYVHASKKGYGDPSELKLFAQNEREETANGSTQQTSHIVLMKCQPGYGGIGCDFPDDPSQPVLPLRQ
jgi:hypothetical protein